MTLCKTCGCQIEGFGSEKSYRGIQWFHVHEGKEIRNKKGQLTERKACSCGCEKALK